MVALFEHDCTEVSVVPRQDPGIADRSHGHDHEVRQVDSGVDVSLGEVESEPQFGVGWRFESVNTIEQGATEGDRRQGLSSRTQHQIDLMFDGRGRCRFRSFLVYPHVGLLPDCADVGVLGGGHS